jgi:hypothetical protein
MSHSRSLAADIAQPIGKSSLIAFTAWSSLVHAAIMAVQAFRNAGERGHLLGDVPPFVIVGAPLIALAPAKQSAERESTAAHAPT